MRLSAVASTLLCAAALAGCAGHRIDRPPAVSEGRARNVILFIGDGMGIPIYTATRVWKVGATGKLAIDTLPQTALCSTYSWNYIVTDSAPSATSILSGVKARNDVIGEGSDAEPGDLPVEGSGREGTSAKSIAELAAEHGLATGVVTTTTVTHATPAACYAHIHHRDLESDIAAQLLTPRFGNPPPDLVFGGGRHFFLPTTSTDPEYADKQGLRTDGRDLIAELRQRGYVYVWNESQFSALDTTTTSRVLALFEPSHMQFERQRLLTAQEPSLAEMTETAIRILSHDPEGYFLMVEGGRIDHALHLNNVEGALQEASMFDEAVRRALALTSAEDTLIIVTADHSHSLTINGYPALGRAADGAEDLEATRRNLLGAGGKDLTGNDYPVLSFATGPGAIEPRPASADSPALFPLPYDTHAGEDVFIAARGPGSARVHGFLTNTQIFDVMRAAFGY
jgi:alkaline phosphatase